MVKNRVVLPSPADSVTVLYGYRHDEVRAHLPPPGEIKEGATLVFNPEALNLDLGHRPPVAVSSGVHVEGVSLPHCDPKDPDTIAAGVQKRFISKPPQFQGIKLRKLRRYVRKQLRSGRFGQPLSHDTDTSFESWIKEVDYPDWRKKELVEVWENMISIHEDPRYLHNKSFMKDEHYTAFKHARGINSRSDQFKCFSGPIFRLIEKLVFNAPEFIKKIPVDQRPNYIFERLWVPDGVYFSSDYSSFESLFVKEVMEAVEFEMYKYFTKFLPDEWFITICRALGGVNVCKFKWFVCKVLATRMSGDMCTSLGNGFSNLMFMEFVCSELGSECIGVVEGDDGLFRIRGKVPTAEDFATLGLIIKCEKHESLETASFCGIVFDLEDRVNVTDPKKVLASTAWITGRYAGSKTAVHKDLLRCKGLSLVYQYPKCPIIMALARYILRVTRGRDLRRVQDMRHMSSYDREWYANILQSEKELKIASMTSREVPNNTRLLVERLYGISWETQIAVEEYLDSLKELQTLNLPWVDFPEAWCEYDETYCRTVPKGERNTPCDGWYVQRGPCSIDRTTRVARRSLKSRRREKSA